MPVSRDNGGQYMMIHEGDLLQGLVSGECSPQDTVRDAAKPMQGHVSLEDPLSRVQEIFDHDNIAVVVEHDDIVGIISKIDIVEFLAART
jgi:cystathionine beta-synthase